MLNIQNFMLQDRFITLRTTSNNVVNSLYDCSVIQSYNDVIYSLPTSTKYYIKESDIHIFISSEE